MTDKDLDKIEKMKAAVPPIDVFTETTAEKNMDKGPGDPFHPLVKMAEASAMDWLSKKLLDKADKLLVQPAKKLKGRTASGIESHRPGAMERR